MTKHPNRTEKGSTPNRVYLCWEAACDEHPLDGMSDSGMIDHVSVGDELFTLVRTSELTGNHFLTPILELVRPSALRTGMPSELEDFLLKALRLRVLPDGRLDLAEGFSTFGDMIAGLQALLRNGIREF